MRQATVVAKFLLKKYLFDLRVANVSYSIVLAILHSYTVLFPLAHTTDFCARQFETYWLQVGDRTIVAFRTRSAVRLCVAFLRSTTVPSSSARIRSLRMAISFSRKDSSSPYFRHQTIVASLTTREPSSAYPRILPAGLAYFRLSSLRWCT
ncbi:hypothetical protein BIW11_05140 [Tropilaelaps mercedesae]|uniref:Uncharacterized protein n=1 Tax=Tropilaelaps mercedesae TaxID=418985 RepID=A0A1V9Y3P7_9ACAR|nr:hypothetical protein BIW11_05140 [Tropilaelaps mercedesae]